MTSATIIADIKAGLAEAIAETGSASSDKIYLLSRPGGGNDPLNPVATSTAEVELVNAIFKAYDKSLIGDNILAGDRQLISDNSVVVKVGDRIKQGSVIYIVVGLSEIAPTSDVLVYKSQVRLQ
ncbi:MAG: hypothetical protein GY928_16420 [Colwellia sp.]|nr:hypothetical protein [Colwellia sp.]